jgi:hypothetical protein
MGSMIPSDCILADYKFGCGMEHPVPRNRVNWFSDRNTRNTDLSFVCFFSLQPIALKSTLILFCKLLCVPVGHILEVPHRNSMCILFFALKSRNRAPYSTRSYSKSWNLELKLSLQVDQKIKTSAGYMLDCGFHGCSLK